MAVDPVARVYGVVIRHLREDTGLSLNKAVKGHAFDSTYLSKIETGNRFPSAQVAETLDKMLDSDLPSTLRAELEQLRTRASAVDEQARDPSAEVIMDETRRRLMLSLGVLGVGAATVPASVLEPIRQAFASSLPDTAYDHSVEDWEEIAGEYAHAFMTTAPSRLLPDLAADVITLQHLIGTTRDVDVKRALCRPGGLLALLMAKTISNLGDQREARHWWHTADASGDTGLRVLVRGDEAVVGLYERRPHRLLEQRIGEALAIGNGGAYTGVAQALGARAQLFAVIGRSDAAAAALREVESTYERLPDSVVSDTTSTFGWSLQRLHHTASFVHTRLGNLPAASQAQDQALALYPSSLPRARAQIQLHRAECLVRTGEVTDGIGHATTVLEGLPDTYRTMMVLDVATSVFDGVPAEERDRTVVRNYRDLLALPSAPPPSALPSGDA
jgi:hypothetical protein